MRTAFCLGVVALLCPLSARADNLGANYSCNPITMFNANPGGSADVSSAVNACAAEQRNGKPVNIYLPAGTYRLNSAVTIGSGQCLYGDSRGVTTLAVDQSFDPAALGVILLTGREQNGPCVKDIDIEFAQPSDQGTRANFETLAQGCTSGTGGTGCKYPPAIYVSTANRFMLSRVRIARAWDGIVNAVGNSTGGYFLDHIELSAFDVGLQLDQAADFIHLTDIHFWDYDISGNLLNVFNDGSTYAAKFGLNGNINGAAVANFADFHGRISIDGATGTWMQFANLLLDGNNATLEINSNSGPGVQISNVYTTGVPNGTTDTNCQINVGASNNSTIISNWSASGPSTGTLGSLCVAGGDVVVTGSRFNANGAGVSQIQQTGGRLQLNGGKITTAGNATVPAILASGGTLLKVNSVNFVPSSGATAPVVHTTTTPTVFVGNNFPSSGANSGSLTIDTDNAANYVSDNANFAVYAASVPSGTLGYYDLGDQPLSLTITPTFSTVGDFSPANNTTSGSYFRRGDWVDFSFDDTFDTNGYTTASGNFRLTHNMPAPLSGNQGACSIGNLNNATLSSVPSCTLGAGTSWIQFPAVVSGSAAAPIGTTAVPPSKTGVSFRIGGRYRIR